MFNKTFTQNCKNKNLVNEKQKVSMFNKKKQKHNRY